jgi:hypothetical protein
MKRSGKLRALQLVFGAVCSFLAAAGSVHCGGDQGNKGTAGKGTAGEGAGGQAGSAAGGNAGNGGSTTGMAGTGGTLDDLEAGGMDYSSEDFFDNDPPPMTCDGGGVPPNPPGGTPQCPDDKNLENCPCPEQGKTAACWPGKRKNRNHGICHDGTTTCKLYGENDLRWGPCVGYQLPTGPTGKAACGCFSGGHWQIDNLSPCFFTQNGTTVAVSTHLVGNQIMCPDNVDSVPAEPWSTDTLKTDCTGYFKLCYAIKAGDPKNPQASDCQFVKVCSEAHYAPANTVVMFPPLPAWLSTPADDACVQQFINTGGYGEMSVVGQSDECEGVDKVFQHVTYCPLSCNDPNPPPECAQCMPGGGGNF